MNKRQQRSRKKEEKPTSKREELRRNVLPMIENLVAFANEDKA